MVETEPEWDQHSRDLAVALETMPTCSVCGGPAAICQSPELEDQWVSPGADRCHVTTVRMRAQKLVDETTDFPHALSFPVYLREPE